MDSTIIDVENLTRRFDHFTAVDRVSFNVRRGEIFAFLGPNGAGKSTTINMLCTLLKPTSGRASINGRDIKEDQAGVRESIGLIFQDPTLDNRLSAWQNLQFGARLYNIPQDTFRVRANDLLELVELQDKAHSSVASFSGGMKRRLEIALGLLHSPRVLFLDEPTIGLDPQTRRRIWQYLLRLRDAEGLTIFLTTHYMDETEVCDRVAVIDKGRLVACGSLDELKSLVDEDEVTLKTSDDERAMNGLLNLGIGAERLRDGIRIRTKNGDEFIPAIVRKLDAFEQPVCVIKVGLRRPSMDDVFLHLTGHDIREEAASSTDKMRGRMRRHMGGRR